MNRFLKSVVFGSAVCLVLGLSLIPLGIVRGAWQQKPSATASRVDELFNRNCARCHGGDGRGDTPSGHLFKAPDFTEPDWWLKNSEITSTRSLRAVVARGKGAMPGFQKKLKRGEINLLIQRIRRFRKSERKN